jgi:hypothetical protein
MGKAITLLERKLIKNPFTVKDKAIKRLLELY